MLARTNWRYLLTLATLILLTAIASVPAFGQSKAGRRVGVSGLSGAVRVRHWLSQPVGAELLGQRLNTLSLVGSLNHFGPLGSTAGPGRGLSADLFNKDATGLPQNEESVSVCHQNPGVVLGATNDYRGLLDPQENFTGWHLSLNNGRSVANEGLLPAVTMAGQEIPSGGDPVAVAASGCKLYAASLNYAFGPSFPEDFFPNGVGVYRSDPKTLANCPGGADPSCWPTRRAVAIAPAPGHFLDKEWIDVGKSGSAGEVVWIAYSDLSQWEEEGGEAVEHSGQVQAVRCTADLSSCTDPIVISVGQQVAEYPDVTIGPDGRVYITWTEFTGGSFTGPAERGWFAVAQPGSTRFSGPRLVVPTDPLVLRGHPIGKIHSNDFRLGGNLGVNTVAMVSGHPRVFAGWTHCKAEVLDGVCEEPQFQIRYSDDLGRAWSGPRTVTGVGDNYFPTLDTDPRTGALVAAFYTSRYDPIFHNRQDVELVALSRTARVTHRVRVTSVSNEPEADPLLGGFFIGDYIEVSAEGRAAYVHYNANQRHVRLLGEGVPIPQQDNYLTKVPI
jgi:hypothetical protein